MFISRTVLCDRSMSQAYSPPTGLFTVGASARHPAQPLAFLTQLIVLIHQPDAQVGQVARVQGGVGGQLPVPGVRLFLDPNVWSEMCTLILARALLDFPKSPHSESRFIIARD